MLTAGLTSLMLLLTCTFIHYEMLALLSTSLDRSRRLPLRPRTYFAILGAVLSHIIQIILFGVVYYLFRDKFNLGTFGGNFTDTFSTFLYFSAETYTSLGFGDIYPIGAIRMLVGVETLTGLVTLGWTASFTYLEMARHWRTS
jgi:hypothetical protein